MMTGTPRKTALEPPSQAVDPSFSLEDFSSFKSAFALRHQVFYVLR